MEHDVLITNLSSRLNEARTIGYLIAFSALLITAVLYINQKSYFDEHDALERKLKQLQDVTSTAQNALQELRWYLLRRGLVHAPDRANATTILQAVYEIRVCRKHLIDVLLPMRHLTQGSDIIRRLKSVGRVHRTRIPPEGMQAESINLSDHFENFNLRDIAELLYLASIDPITTADELDKLTSCTDPTVWSPTVESLEPLMQTLARIRERRPDFSDLHIWAQKLQDDSEEYGSIYGNYAHGGQFSTFAFLRDELRTTEGKMFAVSKEHQDAEIKLPFIWHDLSGMLVATAFPFFILGGFALVALPLSYVRQVALRTELTQGQHVFDLGVLFTELRNGDIFVRYVARGLLGVMLLLPILCALYVVTLPKHNVPANLVLYGTILLSTAVALFILECSWRISEYATQSGKTKERSQPEPEPYVDE